MNKDKLTLFFLALIALIAVGFVLRLARPVVLPLVVAWLLTFIFGPVVNFMTSRKVPLPVTIMLIMILLCGIVFAGAIFLHGRLENIVTEYPKYEERFSRLGQEMRAMIPVPYASLLEFNWTSALRGILVKISGSLFSILSNLILVMIFMVFLLSGKPYVKLKMKRALSDQRADQLNRIIGSISSEISRYLSVLMLISLGTGILVWLALFIIGIDFPVTWGALAFFLNFIPTLGSIVASIPPILLAFVQYYPSLWPGVVTLMAVAAIQMIVGNLITPKILGERLHLSPVVILVSLLFWGWLWGIIGAILAVPIASAIKIICENIDELKPISIMMGSGRRLWQES